MAWLHLLAFSGTGFLAATFIIIPMWKEGRSPPVVMLLTALVFTAFGGGLYTKLGRPDLVFPTPHSVAERSPDMGRLIAAVQRGPGNSGAWLRLADAYMALNDPGNAALAYRRVLPILAKRGPIDPAVAVQFGESLVAASGGKVTPEALTVFENAAAHDPRNPAARYFIGQALAEGGDVDAALAYWRALLADTPATLPLHGVLRKRIDALENLKGSLVPAEMVRRLATQLRSQPHDSSRWRQLIRSYSVLGQHNKAYSALLDARAEFADDGGALKELAGLANDLHLEGSQ